MRTGFCAAALILSVSVGARSAADPDFPQKREAPTVLPGDAFDLAAAEAIGVSTTTIGRWRAKGFGKTEVLILGEMVRRSTWTFDALGAARDGGATLETLSRQCGADYLAAFRAARESRRRIEDALLLPGAGPR
ncbi:MAG: hypothetical protein IPP68_10325 [Elusimicrobia bacterium]|nr:hypothetical protein [Elusimicrobiota bacterium]